jgi:uncharacterized sodium:solute symporter family permease YidK
MTDLFQGLMLLGTGIMILFLGINYLGGLEDFWQHLPRAHKLPFPNFNEDPSFPSVGIFWQDGIANTAMFYFLNQGVIMRFLSTKSLQDGRKAIFTVILVLMPIAACVVASGGWVAKAMVHAGILPGDLQADEAFFIASDFLSRPGIFGLILATMTAALMSTVDTLITAVAAIVVNDVYRPMNPKANEKNPGYSSRERAWMDEVVHAGYVDTFRLFNTDPGQYTWWSYRFNARAKNIGWRIDYFFVNEGFVDQLEDADIHDDIMGSDHCPVSLTLNGKGI